MDLHGTDTPHGLSNFDEISIDCRLPYTQDTVIKKCGDYPAFLSNHNHFRKKTSSTFNRLPERRSASAPLREARHIAAHSNPEPLEPA